MESEYSIVPTVEADIVEEINPIYESADNRNDNDNDTVEEINPIYESTDNRNDNDIVEEINPIYESADYGNDNDYAQPYAKVKSNR